MQHSRDLEERLRQAELELLADQLAEAPPPIHRINLLRTVRRYPLAVMGGIILVTLAFVAIFADRLAPYDP